MLTESRYWRIYAGGVNIIPDVVVFPHKSDSMGAEVVAGQNNSIIA